MRFRSFLLVFAKKRYELRASVLDFDEKRGIFDHHDLPLGLELWHVVFFGNFYPEGFAFPVSLFYYGFESNHECDFLRFSRAVKVLLFCTASAKTALRIMSTSLPFGSSRTYSMASMTISSTLGGGWFSGRSDSSWRTIQSAQNLRASSESMMMSNAYTIPPNVRVLREK